MLNYGHIEHLILGVRLKGHDLNETIKDISKTNV
jgi:hypothetical protein